MEYNNITISWQTDGIKVINGLPMYKVASNQYIPKKYTTETGVITINAIAGVNSVNSKGKKLDVTFKDQIKWLAPDTSVRMINGRLHFQIATDQYIDAFYAIGG